MLPAPTLAHRTKIRLPRARDTASASSPLRAAADVSEQKRFAQIDDSRSVANPCVYYRQDHTLTAVLIAYTRIARFDCGEARAKRP